MLSGTIGWTAGTLGGTLTLASCSTLNITAGGNHFIGGCVFDQFGTVTWSGGYLYGGGGAAFYNYGLWNAQDDQQMRIITAAPALSLTIMARSANRAEPASLPATRYFASGVVFNQLAGVIDVQNGTNGLQLALSGGGNFTGGYFTTNSAG